MAPSSSTPTCTSSPSTVSPSSDSSLMVTSASPISPLGAEELRRDCGYCANGKTLRDILPPKKCDYCFKYKCQFCTLRFPLIKVKKGLPKAMKGNSRICLHCFHQMWSDHAASGALSSGTEMPSSMNRRSSLGRRASSMQEEDELSSRDGLSRRDSLRDSTLRNSTLRDSTLRDSFIDDDDEDTSTTPPLAPSASKRVARTLGLVLQTDTPKPQDVVHVVDLWLSMFAAMTLLFVVLVDHLTLQQRVAFCVIIYGGFLAVHPWIHNVTVAVPRSRPSVARRRSSVSPEKKVAFEPESELKPLEIPPSTTVPEVLRPTLVHMEERFNRILSDPTQWKLVKTTNIGKIYEIPNELSQPMFMLDTFVQGISITEFLAYMYRTDLKDRSVWDWNVGAFEIVEEYKDDNTSIVYNAQKAFLGGLVSARDFCVLYKRNPTSSIYASAEHPKVPERPHATRGIVHLAGLNCTPAKNDKGEDGFQLQYMAQVDIGGNIPTRLLYSGQVDNMEKNMKSFHQAHKLFRKKH